MYLCVFVCPLCHNEGFGVYIALQSVCVSIYVYVYMCMYICVCVCVCVCALYVTQTVSALLSVQQTSSLAPQRPAQSAVLPTSNAQVMGKPLSLTWAVTQVILVSHMCVCVYLCLSVSTLCDNDSVCVYPT